MISRVIPLQTFKKVETQICSVLNATSKCTGPRIKQSSSKLGAEREAFSGAIWIVVVGGLMRTAPKHLHPLSEGKEKNFPHHITEWNQPSFKEAVQTTQLNQDSLIGLLWKRSPPLAAVLPLHNIALKPSTSCHSTRYNNFRFSSQQKLCAKNTVNQRISLHHQRRTCNGSLDSRTLDNAWHDQW